MRPFPTWLAALLLFLALPGGARAHALDEYLQAAQLVPEPERIVVTLRLVPGVAALPKLLPVIDRDGDGHFSAVEQERYAAQVMADIALTADGKPLASRLTDAAFSTLAQMQDGMGQIRLVLEAALPQSGAARALTFENRHQRAIGAYLANILLPQDGTLQLLSQDRSRDQSFYAVRYEAGGGSAMVGEDAGFRFMFRMGLHHIADGTDHLLFLLTLLLPAPLFASRGRWAGATDARASLWRIGVVVSAFTAGHSLTLAAAALGLVPAGGAVIETLIAVSILVSAIHALRPLFPGREALVAGSFGLIHGLAFATTLDALALDWWARVTALLGFNLGIEAMQLLVVAAAMPSLLLLSRTSAYDGLRVGGGMIAAIAALGWLAERSMGWPNPMANLLEAAARQAPWLALALLLASLTAWALRLRAARAD